MVARPAAVSNGPPGQGSGKGSTLGPLTATLGKIAAVALVTLVGAKDADEARLAETYDRYFTLALYRRDACKPEGDTRELDRIVAALATKNGMPKDRWIARDEETYATLRNMSCERVEALYAERVAKAKAACNGLPGCGQLLENDLSAIGTEAQGPAKAPKDISSTCINDFERERYTKLYCLARFFERSRANGLKGYDKMSDEATADYGAFAARCPFDAFRIEEVGGARLKNATEFANGQTSTVNRGRQICTTSGRND